MNHFIGNSMKEFFSNGVWGIAESSNEQSYQFVADQLGASWKAILFTGTQPAKRPSKYPCDPLNSLPSCCCPIRIITRENHPPSSHNSHNFQSSPTRCFSPTPPKILYRLWKSFVHADFKAPVSF